MSSLGCMKPICGGNINSNVRPCQSDGSDCGHFEGKRWDFKTITYIDGILVVITKF